jgi:hypothetical protein
VFFPHPERSLAAKSAMEPPTTWWQHAIADDVLVWVRHGPSPWRTKQLRAAVKEFARRVRPEKGKCCSRQLPRRSQTVRTYMDWWPGLVAQIVAAAATAG